MSSNQSLVELLNKLASSDGEMIRETTTKLKKFMSTNESVGELFSVVCDNGHAVGVRNAAAVMLRKKMRSYIDWPENQKIAFKSNLLKLIGMESEKAVRHNLVELAARTFAASYDAASHVCWQELVDFIRENARVPQIEQRELAYSLLYSLLNSLTDDALPLLSLLSDTIAQGLVDEQSAHVRYESLKCTDVLVTDSECWSEEQEEEGQSAIDAHLNILAGLVQRIPSTIRSLLSSDLSLDTDLFDVFGVCLTHTRLIRNVNLNESVELAIEVMSCDGVNHFVRKGALGYLADLAKTRSSVISKMNGATETVLRRVFAVLCSLEESEHEHDSLLQQCSQTLDILAQRLPSSVVAPILLNSCIEPALSPGQPPFTTRAAYLALAVSTEGCCRYYAEHSIGHLITLILNGINNSHSAISLSALFALGELLSYTDTHGAQFGDTFMPILLQSLSKISGLNFEESDEDTQLWISRLFYTLEEACECLDNAIVPFLGELFTRIFAIQKSNKSERMQQFVLESVSFAVSAADKLIAPYVDGLLEVVSSYIKAREENASDCLAFTEALSALSSIFRYAETPQLKSYADSAAQFAIHLLKTEGEEPAERSAAYDVMAALTYVYKQHLNDQFVNVAVEQSIKTLADDDDNGNNEDTGGSKDEIGRLLRNGAAGDMVMHGQEEEEEGDEEDDDVADISDIADDDDDDDDDEDDDDFEILERDSADERVSALSLLSDITVNSEDSLVPHFEKIWPFVHRHLDHPDEDIQSTAVKCAACLLVMCFSVAKKQSVPVDGSKIEAMLLKFYEELEEKIKENEVHALVISALNGLQVIISGFDKAFFSVVSVERISQLLELVLARKITCLNTAVDTDIDLEEPELDGLVMEGAGDVLPACATADYDHFVEHFGSCIALLLNQLKRPNSSRKAFVVATLACCIQNQPVPIVDNSIAFELFNTLMTDPNLDVSQNSVYGMRVLVDKASQYCAPHFESILNRLHSLVSSHNVKANTPSPLKDNICGCACAILKVVANSPAHPVTSKTIFEFILTLLPLTADKENYIPFYECMASDVMIENAPFANTDDIVQKLIHEAVKLSIENESDFGAEGIKSLYHYVALQAQRHNNVFTKVMEMWDHEKKEDVLKKISQVHLS